MKKSFLPLLVYCSLYGADVDMSTINEAMQQNHQMHLVNQKLTELEYKKRVEANFQYYQDVFKESEKYYKKILSQKWGKDETRLSSKNSFTQYNDDLSSRETIDYKKGEVVLEILDDSFFNDTKEFQKKFNHLTATTIDESFFNDPVNRIAMNFLKEKDFLKNQKRQDKSKLLNSSLFDNKIIKKEDIKHKVVDTKQGKKKISYVVIKMVPENLQIRAKRFKDSVHENAERFNVQDSLVFGIMQTESYFNPLARSHIPAFGLMQIVPSSAGKDSYLALYGKKRILSPNYLYNTKNNIEIGTKYIQIIQDNYLKGITDPKKLFYCTATAYNAGIGSLCKSITGEKKITNFSKIQKEAIEKINKMSVDELYKHLTTSSRLTHEAQNYVVKVEKNSKNYLAWDR
ncbi:MAG: murein transglycosylase domain-containing protein [Campylobacterota bacterium]|nr:murein transglycosylase domain-containing protein [Campylobacterota bacterium]